MARRDFGPSSTSRRLAPRRGGGMLKGLLVGLLLGIIVAAAVAWFVSREPEEDGKETQVDAVLPSKPKSSGGKTPGVKPPTAKSPPPSVHTEPAKPRPVVTTPTKPPVDPAPTAPVRALPPPIDGGYDYGRILGGDKPLKPRLPARPQEQWWLQVAALQNEDDARRLRRKLLLLNLDALVLRAEVGNVLLYRVRVGPFRSQEDSIASLEILSQNNYTPRTLKETVLQ